MCNCIVEWMTCDFMALFFQPEVDTMFITPVLAWKASLTWHFRVSWSEACWEEPHVNSGYFKIFPKQCEFGKKTPMTAWLWHLWLLGRLGHLASPTPLWLNINSSDSLFEVYTYSCMHIHAPETLSWNLKNQSLCQGDLSCKKRLLSFWHESSMVKTWLENHPKFEGNSGQTGLNPGHSAEMQHWPVASLRHNKTLWLDEILRWRKHDKFNATHWGYSTLVDAKNQLVDLLPEDLFCKVCASRHIYTFPHLDATNSWHFLTFPDISWH